MKKTKIFVDGNCIVCDREISHYKRLAPHDFELVDISSPEFVAGDFNLTREAVDRHMHAITPDGKVVKGVEAFAHIWSRIPRYAWATRWINMPVIHPIAQVGYEIFARVRPYLPKRKS